MYSWRPLTVAVLFVAFGLAGLCETKKNYKDRAEFDLYSAVVKDFETKDYKKALSDLDVWNEKYPQSDFKDDRQVLYVHAYAGLNEQGKALDAGSGLLAKDPASLFRSEADRIRLLYALVTGVEHVASPSAEQAATANEAARQLEAMSKPPAGMSDADWQKAEKGLKAAARSAQLYLVLNPVAKALQAKDCKAAETEALKAQGQFPESVQAAWYLGSAQLCLSRTDPSKASPALYEFARAAALDPVKGMVDPKWQQTTVVPYLEKAYTQYHGVDPEGLNQLKQLAVNSPLPGEGFAVKSAAQVAEAKQADLESKHPEYALWLKIKSALTASDGEQYFASGMKGAAIPRLEGVLAGAKPPCNPKELLVAVPKPGSAAGNAEIVLELDKPLHGKPELNTPLSWEGVASSFDKEPFRLTMQTEAGKISGLKTSACSVAPRTRRISRR
ncbi:MAG: hypothetical protein IT167_07715 [Bryobacterales bacterium]|nr:hypothetical protein [Bryobacterales bacterium]